MKKKNAELRELSVNELQDELLALRKKQFNLRIAKANDDLKKRHHVKQIRRNVARVKTIMTEKLGVDNEK